MAKKFNPKYTRGSSNVGERKRLMSEISAIYKKYRGTKDKRKKKGFPPAKVSQHAWAMARVKSAFGKREAAKIAAKKGKKKKK